MELHRRRRRRLLRCLRLRACGALSVCLKSVKVSRRLFVRKLRSLTRLNWFPRLTRVTRHASCRMLLLVLCCLRRVRNLCRRSVLNIVLLRLITLKRRRCRRMILLTLCCLNVVRLGLIISWRRLRRPASTLLRLWFTFASWGLRGALNVLLTCIRLSLMLIVRCRHPLIRRLTWLSLFLKVVLHLGRRLALNKMRRLLWRLILALVPCLISRRRLLIVLRNLMVIRRRALDRDRLLVARLLRLLVVVLGLT